MPAVVKDLLAHVLSKIKINENGCWEWQGAVLKSGGYGILTHKQKSIRVHRYVYEQFKGKIPDGLLLCHRCDNPPCCNPDHLFPGTDDDNMKDAQSKGRIPRGMDRYNAKLTDDDVLRIRSDPRLHRIIAEEYGVSHSLVTMIKGNKKRSSAHN